MRSGLSYDYRGSVSDLTKDAPLYNPIYNPI